MELITIFAMVQAAVVLYLLKIKPEPARHFAYLKVLIFLLLCHMGVKVVYLYFLDNNALFSKLNSFTSFSYGPLLYFSYREVKGKPLGSVFKVLHLIPFAMAACIYFYVLLTNMIVHRPALFDEIFLVFSRLLTVSLVAYTVYMLLGLLDWQRKNDHSFDKKYRLLLHLNLLILGVPVLGWLTHYMNVYYQTELDVHTGPYLMFAIAPVLILKYVYQDQKTEVEPSPAIGPTPHPDATEKALTRPTKTTYAHSAYTESQLEEWWKQLESCMDRKRLWQNPELSQDELASCAQLSRHQLSQVLNHYKGQNFYQYVNGYRVKKVVTLMKQKPGASILSLAMEAGFQSKSTLNAHFKRVMGMNPSEYYQSVSMRSGVS